MKRRYTTREQDREFLRRAFADATRDWKVGDACLAYRGGEATTVARVEGDIVYLANGDQMHRTKMRSVTGNALDVLKQAAKEDR